MPDEPTADVTTARDALPLPLRIEEIDAPWLTAALRSYTPDVEVQHSEVVDVIHGTSTKIRVRLDMNAAGRDAGIPRTVIVKGGFEEHSRGMARMYATEARFYRDLAPVGRIHVPTCYFAGIDDDAGQSIVIMDDLVARGVSFCDPLVPQTFTQMKRRLSSLAEFHASTWDSPELLPGGSCDWVDDGPTLFRSYFEYAGYFRPEVWQRFVDLPRGAASSVRFHDVEWARRAIHRLAELAEGLPKCIVHGDTHLGNLYEESDGTPGFFDCGPRKEPPHIEIAYHIAGGLDPADRPEFERPLLAHYVEALAKNGVDAPSVEEMMHYYGLFMALGFVIFHVNESQFQPESVNTAYTARFSAAMIDHRTRQRLDRVEVAHGL